MEMLLAVVVVVVVAVVASREGTGQSSHSDQCQNTHTMTTVKANKAVLVGKAHYFVSLKELITFYKLPDEACRSSFEPLFMALHKLAAQEVA